MADPTAPVRQKRQRDKGRPVSVILRDPEAIAALESRQQEIGQREAIEEALKGVKPKNIIKPVW